MSKRERNDPAYLREQGKRQAQGARRRKITFSLSKHIKGEGQTVEEWEKLGLLSILFNRIKHACNFTPVEVRRDKCIKEYNKVDFPPDSEFKKPNHVVGVTWAVMHITSNSKEVVVGYIDDDVFYIIFLDKDHKFWPSSLKNT